MSFTRSYYRLSSSTQVKEFERKRKYWDYKKFTGTDKLTSYKELNSNRPKGVLTCVRYLKPSL